MKMLRIAGLLLAACPLWGYPYYINDNFASIDPTRWTQTGSLSGSGTGLSGNGLLISSVAVSNDYDVRITVNAEYSNNYSLYARSNANGSTAYVLKLENVTVDNSFGSLASGQFTLYRVIAGVSTALTSFWQACPDGTVMRLVVRQNDVSVYVNSETPHTIQDGNIASGQPGAGVVGGSIANITAGPIDTAPPQAVAASTIKAAVLRNGVNLQWGAATDNTDGIGISGYSVYRDGNYAGAPKDPSFVDGAAAPGAAYTYTIYTRDQHGNVSPGSSATVAVPLAGASAALRTGSRATGAYWGAAGEQIDLVSGNLNFSVPLITVQGRGGPAVTLGLTYNSQLWRASEGVTWKLGADVGYGFGWRLQAGSIVPVWFGSNLNHYVFIDGTGAEYRLEQNAGGVWSSREGIHLWFDSGSNRLYFPDGRFWNMWVQSSGYEEDAGALYPSLVQDTNGNQVLISYASGLAAPTWDSSARVRRIRDVRNPSPDWYNSGSYDFAYDTQMIPHLIGIANNVGSSEAYDFAYQDGQALVSPFNANSFGNAALLQTVTTQGLALTHTFGYATGSAELTSVATPLGGTLRWTYRTSTGSDGGLYRVIQNRYMRPSSGAAEATWTATLGDAASPPYSSATLADQGANSSKTWWFRTDPGIYLGMATAYEERNGSGTALLRKEYTWTADASGSPYVGSVTTRLDPGQAYEVQSKSEQTLDAYGNITQSRLYNYGNLTTPAKTFDYQYLTDSTYTSRFIRNRVTAVSMTAGGATTVLATNTYDNTLGYCAGLVEREARYHDAAYNTGFIYRGNLSYTNKFGAWTCYSHETTGVVYATTDSSGLSVQSTPSSSTAYSLPWLLTPNGNENLATSIAYAASFAVTSVTGPNNANTATTYDAYGRPATATLPDGAQTSYSYAYDPPTQTAHLGDRWKRTTLDGFGRPVKIETGHGLTTVSVVDSEYGPCACSPLGKLTRSSLPHAPGATVLWTTYEYDGCGRTTGVTAPDNSRTSYVYQGNETTVTDPAGKWKKLTTDAFGNLVRVTEPRP